MIFRKKADTKESLEKQLLKGCLKGERRAQRAFYDHFASKMLVVCARYTKDRDEAQDVLHEGFIKAFSNLNRFEGKGSLEGWVRRIMVNTALEHFRKSKSLYLAEDISLAETLAHDDHILERMSADEILKMVQHLPAGFRMVFNLYAIEGFSHKEISEKLGISIGTSKSQLSRARATLQNLVDRNNRSHYGQQAESR